MDAMMPDPDAVSIRIECDRDTAAETRTDYDSGDVGGTEPVPVTVAVCPTCEQSCATCISGDDYCPMRKSQLFTGSTCPLWEAGHYVQHLAAVAAPSVPCPTCGGERGGASPSIHWAASSRPLPHLPRRRMGAPQRRPLLRCDEGLPHLPRYGGATMTAHSATCESCRASHDGYQCRRHAPTVVAISTYEYGERVVAPVTVFPDTTPDDWCCEHLPCPESLCDSTEPTGVKA